MDDGPAPAGMCVQLWGGPEDGATVYVPPGPAPLLVGVHRMADGALVPIRGRSLDRELAHVQVYERAHPAWVRLLLPGWRRGYGRPLYVHRELLERWTAQGSG